MHHANRNPQPFLQARPGHAWAAPLLALSLWLPVGAALAQPAAAPAADAAVAEAIPPRHDRRTRVAVDPIATDTAVDTTAGSQ